MAEEASRPVPEALLAEANKEGLGRLKVFLGAAPGVGKTYAMLEAARLRRRDGVDVVIGIVETHGRFETAQLLHGLEVLPRKRLSYRGRIFTEMDLEALLQRKPKLAIVDELAHTNIPGSRHIKRWQDVEELLKAGIDVYTTINIQHLESLNDVVARISSVRVRETIPDRVLELADEIELVDLPPDELIQRLREGKVYAGEQVGRAIDHFFSKGTLTALREIAMRVAAERIDAQMLDYMRAHAIAGPWPAQDRLLVCLNESPLAKRLVRATRRLAERARLPWIAVYVQTPGYERLAEDAKDRIAEAMRLAETLGGEAVTLHAGSDIADEVLAYARARNVTRLVLGRPRPRRLSAWLRERVAEAIIRKADQFDIILVAGDGPDLNAQPIRTNPQDLRLDWRAFVPATLTMVGATLLSVGFEQLVPGYDPALIFVTGLLYVAIKLGLWPSVYASLLGVAAYNFLFTEPRYTFIVNDVGDLAVMVFFMIVAVLTGNLAARLKAQVKAMRATARRTSNLFEFSRKIAGAASLDDVLWAAVHHVAATLQCRSLILLPAKDGRLEIAMGYPPEDQLGPRDWGAVDWAWQHGESAGWSSDTLPAADWLFLPLKTVRGPVGVLGISFEGEQRTLTNEQRQLLDGAADQVTIAIERTSLAADLERTRVASETERLRTALLSSVSHDFRTPLVSIIGSATSLAADRDRLPEEHRRQLVETILDEGERLNRYVQNLLDMMRLGNGALQPKRDWCDLHEIAGRAVGAIRKQLGQRRLEVDLPDDLPLISVDAVLMEQVLVNILDNAVKYTPAHGTIRLAARARQTRLWIDVTDQGPGIPESERELIFDIFYRVRSGDGQPAGTGVGLAICRGLVEVHGGKIRALPGPDQRGTRIEIELPLTPPPPAWQEEGVLPAYDTANHD